MGLSGSKLEVEVGEVWTHSAQEYILLLKRKAKNILVSRDGLKLVIHHDGTIEEWGLAGAALVVSATYLRLAPCVSAEVVKGRHDVIDQIGYVQKALHLVRDLQETCKYRMNTHNWNNAQTHKLRWAERQILQAKTHICKKFENILVTSNSQPIDST